jgi:hypothetical protein
MSQERKNTAIFTAFDDHEQPELATPERNLLRAVLINAIADMARPGEFSRRARDYFTSSEDDYVFAFRSVCQYLNVDPHHILMLVGLEENTRARIRSEVLSTEPTPVEPPLDSPAVNGTQE